MILETLERSPMAADGPETSRAGALAVLLSSGELGSRLMLAAAAGAALDGAGTGPERDADRAGEAGDR